MGKHKSKAENYKPRVCVFCGKTPLSREELWPFWIRKILPKDPFNSYRFSATTRTSLWQRHYNTTITNKNGQLSRRQIKEFCEICNNGWMSRLESSVQNLLTPLIEKGNVQLSGNDLYKILIWSTLRIIILDVGEPIRMISKAEREKFFQDQLPLNKLTIWFGKTDTAYPYHYSFETTQYSNIIAPLSTRNTRAYTYMCGGFIIYAIYHTGQASFTTLWDLPSSKLVRLKTDAQPFDTNGLPSMAEMEIDFLRLSFLNLQLRADK